MGLKQKSTMLAMYMDFTVLIWSFGDFALKLNDPKIPLILKSGILCTCVNFEFWVDSQFIV